MREEKMKHVMSDLTGQERMRVEDMINRQTQEMLELIDQKVGIEAIWSFVCVLNISVSIVPLCCPVCIHHCCEVGW